MPCDIVPGSVIELMADMNTRSESDPNSASNVFTGFIYQHTPMLVLVVLRPEGDSRFISALVLHHGGCGWVGLIVDNRNFKFVDVLFSPSEPNGGQ